MSRWSALKARIPHRYKYGARSLLSRLKTGKPLYEDTWQIGIYAGASPFHLEPLEGTDGPVLTPGAVSDARAMFLADPFMLQAGGGWHLFFEIWNRRQCKGEIAHATSRDLAHWDYQGVVLAEPFHLSYPYVFAWEGEHYMVPETSVDGSVRLYQADPFPGTWRYRATLLEGVPYKDASLVRHEGRWWAFVDTSPGLAFDTLGLFSAEDLLGPWVEHPRSPIVVGDATSARPAGRAFVHDGHVVRFAQDCATEYGRLVRAFRATVLTPSDYREEPVGTVLEPTGSGWNGRGMHHLDPHLQPDGRWVACVDGRSA